MGANSRYGDDFDQDLRDGELPSFSLRALGTVENTARGAEVKNMTIITWDRVYFPSHKRAYTKKLVSESAGNVTESGIITTNDPGIIIPITNDSIRSYIMQESANMKMITESFDTLYDSIVLIEGGNKVQLTDKTGNTFIIYLESHIQNELMGHCR